MVLEFLQSIHEAYDLSRISKEQEIERISTHELETSRFIELLKSEHEGKFTRFSPRNIANKNTKKIDELEAELSELVARRESIEKELSDVNSWLKDIDDCIQEIHSTTTKVPTKDIVIDQPKSKVLDQKDSARDESHELSLKVNQLMKIKASIGRIVEFLPADPIRARLELLHLFDEI